MDVSGVILQVATTRNIYKRSAEEVPSTRIHPARLCQPKMERNNPISPGRYNLSCCLIGILIIFIMVYCNSHTSWVFIIPRKTPNNQGPFFSLLKGVLDFFVVVEMVLVFQTPPNSMLGCFGEPNPGTLMRP